jgi:hypothetical protein
VTDPQSHRQSVHDATRNSLAHRNLTHQEVISMTRCCRSMFRAAALPAALGALVCKLGVAVNRPPTQVSLDMDTESSLL